MNFIKNRLKRLENERRNRCPECGLPPGGPGRTVVYEDEEGGGVIPIG